MSKILTGLNESTYRKYDNNRTGFSRGPRDDERHDLDVRQPSKQEWALKINGKVWSKDGKTVTFASKEQALKARQSLLSKRPELEVGLVTRGGVAEAGTGLDIDRSIPGRTIARISGDIKHRTGSPSGKKLPDYHPDDDYYQWSGKTSASIGDDEEDTFDKDYMGNDEDERLNELSNEKLGQYKTKAAADAGKRDLAGDYKKADKRFSGIVKATKKQFANDTKTVKEDINSVYTKAKLVLSQLNESMQQQVLDTLKKSLDDEEPKDQFKSLPESLGDELKSKSIQALEQVKKQLEQQRMADLEQWEKDFKQNTVAKFTAREPKLTQRVTSTPTVSMPGEKHSVLKNRLVQLDKAIEKQGILDNLVQKLDKKGLLTPNIQAGVDTSILVRDGARDNYVELNRKLDKALEYVKNRLLTNKAAYAKPKAIDEDEKVSGRMRMNDYYDLADAIQEKLKQAIQMGDKARIQQLNKQRDELDAHIKKHGMMPENVAEDELDENCWKGYHKEGNKKMFGKTVPNCVKNEDIDEDNHRVPRKAGQPANSKKHSDLYTDENPKGTITGLKFATEEDARASVSKIRNSGRSHAHKVQAAVAMEQRARAAGKASAAKVYRDYINSVKKTNEEQIYEMSSEELDKMSPEELVRFANDARNNKLKNIDPNSIDKAYGKSISIMFPDSDKRNTQSTNHKQQGVVEEKCPHCNGPMFSEMIMNEKKDACYYKVKSRYKVWPSAYASGALVKCRKKGASNWGTGGKKNESSILEGIEIADESLHDWFNKEKWVRMDTKGNIKGPCAREPGEGKPKCLPQSKAHSLGKKGRASAAQRKRREDPNPERSGKAINVNTKKKSNEGVAEGNRPFRGVGGAFDRGDDERHDLDPTDWYFVKDGKMFAVAVYPNQEQQAIAQGYSRTRDEAKAKAGRQGVAEDQLDEKWSKKYKDSINCSNPKGFSQKAHCASKKK
jgi:hypothetical protein